ncbi:hypothetical protein B0O99DRAFT_728435 [Bisporella sp. PMI_857]|nr:hypothetical protein B0O99DRAFT_728435 [Bisporella sp. PMI_857]
MPNPNLVSMAPLSFPIIGLLGFAHYTVTCRVMGKTPWGMRDCLQGMAGHSQGIIVAAVIACSGSWEEYYKSVAIAMELLFRIGLESYFAVPVFPLSQAEMRDNIQAGEGQPSPILNVRGLDQESLQGFITDTNRAVSEKDSIYLTLISSPDNMVISGPPASLKELCLRLRELEVGINSASPLIQYRFLPISSPFHSPHLQDAAK